MFIPRALGGRRAALDFACTSGLRADALRTAATGPERVLSDYGDFKKSFKAAGESEITDLSSLCASIGNPFIHHPFTIK